MKTITLYKAHYECQLGNEPDKIGDASTIQFCVSDCARGKGIVLLIAYSTLERAVAIERVTDVWLSQLPKILAESVGEVTIHDTYRTLWTITALGKYDKDECPF